MNIRNLFKSQIIIPDSLESGTIEDLNERKLLWINWILDSNVGDMGIYWNGFLSRDRDPVRPGSIWPNTIARLMWTVCHTPKAPAGDNHMNWGSGMGLVELSQRKIDTENYMYRARKIVPVPAELKPVWRSTLLTV